MHMNPVVHFEMPYEDMNRMTDFYVKTFGWKANFLGPSMGDYVVVDTSEYDQTTKLPTMPGRINGGLFKKTKDNQHPSVVIAVPDIIVAMKNVAAAGGTVVGGQVAGEPDNIPGVGLYVLIIDTEGNRISMLQPNAM